MIRVLVVEDSSVVREFVVHILRTDPEIVVIGTATNGEEALEVAALKKPDIITMDIHMPKMDGLEATRRIMETDPRPIVIVSGSVDVKETTAAFQALEAGALAAVARPMGIGHSEHEATAAELIQTVKLMAEVKVVKRWPRRQRDAVMVSAQAPVEVAGLQAANEIKLAAIGASTGGPLVLQTILSALPGNYPIPIMIVQHMAAGFIEGFVEWLGRICPLPMQVAKQGQQILPGQVYVAPDGLQMTVERKGKLRLSPEGPQNGHRPSVCYLFRSVAAVYGPEAVGVLLTGMGRDGAEGLKAMRDRGAVTIAQDSESSVVHGMPGEAIRLDAATYVLAPDAIAATLATLANQKTEAGASREWITGRRV